MEIVKKFLIFSLAFLIALSLFALSMTKVYAAADFGISNMKNGSFEISFRTAQSNLKAANFHISYQIENSDTKYFEDIEISTLDSTDKNFLIEYKALPTSTSSQYVIGEVYYNGLGTVGFEFKIEADSYSTDNNFRVVSSKNGSFIIEFDSNKSSITASSFSAELFINNVYQRSLNIKSINYISGYANKFEVFYDPVIIKSYIQDIQIEISYKGGAARTSHFVLYSDGSVSDENIGYEYSYLDAPNFSIVDIENGELKIRFDYDVLRNIKYSDFSSKYYIDGVYKGSIDFTKLENSETRPGRDFTLYFDPIQAADKNMTISLLLFYDIESDKRPATESFTIFKESETKEVDIKIASVKEFKESIILPQITITEKSKNTISESSKSRMSKIKLELPDGFIWSKKGDVTGKDALSDVIDYEIDFGANNSVLMIGIINSEANRTKTGSLLLNGLEISSTTNAPLGEVKLRISGAGIPYERFTVANYTLNPSSAVKEPSYTVKLIDGFSQMYVNDTTLAMDTKPFISNNRFMLPVSYIAVAFGIPPTYDNIKWDAAKRNVIVRDGDKTIEFSIGSKVMFVNGVPREMDSSAVIKDNRTFVPMRALGEALGFEVNWNAQSRTAILTK